MIKTLASNLSEIFWIAVLSLFIAPSVAGQSAIITDRPDFTESAVSVSTGAIQIEGGFSRTDSGSLKSLSLPEMLIRFGISDGFEIRAVIPDYVDTDVGSGLGDMSLGFKLELTNLLLNWATAVLGQVDLPTGEKGYSGETIGVGVILAAGTDLSDSWSLGTQVSMGLTGDGNENNFEFGANGVVGTSLTEIVGSFFELALSVPEHGGAGMILHGGFLFLIKDYIQLDIHGGLGLTDASPDSIIGAGFSIGL